MSRAWSTPVLVGTALAVLLADQATKAAVRVWLTAGRPVWIVDHILSLDRVQNTGAAFSLLAGHREIFIGVTIVVLAGAAWAWFTYRPSSLWIALGLGLLVGGALGNLIDRAVVGSVTDFIDLQVWPVFNVADSAVDVGAAVIVAWLVFASPAGKGRSASAPGEGSDGR